MSKVLMFLTLFFSIAGFQILEMRSTHWILKIVAACLLFVHFGSAGKKTVYYFIRQVRVAGYSHNFIIRPDLFLDRTGRLIKIF